MELIQNLENISTKVNDWLKFAEQKLSGLILFNAGVTWGYSKLVLNSDIIIPLSENFNIAGYIFLFISTLLSTIAIMPVLSSFWYYKTEKTSLDNLQYFGDIHKYNSREYVTAIAKTLGLTNHSILDYESDLAGQIIINSKITSVKFSRYKLSSVITLLAIFSFSIAQVINIFSS